MKTKAKNNWEFWRLVLDGGLGYSDTANMDYEEIAEANAAMDIYIEKQNKANKPRK